MVTSIKHQHAVRVYDFTRSVIRHRNLLLSTNKSSINKMKALRIIEQLVRNNHKNATDVAASKFLVKHADDLRYIIKQGDFDKFNQLNNLLAVSKPLSKL